MLKTERIELIIGILISQMNHWLFFPVVLTSTGVYMQLAEIPIEETPDLLLWAVCGLIPITCLLVRLYAERFWLFILCHGAVAAATLFFSILFGRRCIVICGVCAAAYILHSFLLRLKEDAAIYSTAVHPVVAVALSVAANFMLHRKKGVPNWDRYYLYTLMGVLACYLIIYYLKHYLSFLRMNQLSAGYVPAKEILRSGISYVMLYTLVIILVLGLTQGDAWLGPILGAVKEAMRKFLGLMISILSEEESSKTLIQEPDAGYTPEAGLFQLWSGTTSGIWERLENIVPILAFCAFAIGMMKAIIWFVRFMKERFQGRPQRNASVNGEEGICDIHEKCGVIKDGGVGERKDIFQRFTPKERIRRLYKRKVLSDTSVEDREFLAYMTARECGDRLSLPQMSDIYEQARYSDRKLTDADVKRMKRICGQISVGAYERL